MERLITAQGRSISYAQTPGRGPGVLFLGGFRSDMTGTKALYLQDRAARTGRALMRFDYSGHGSSAGQFTDGTIGDWMQDALAMLDLTEGPQILVGSSMGGWIALLIAQAFPARVAGLVTIAAAPDFTEDSMWAEFDPKARQTLTEQGIIHLPSAYGDPYPVTLRLIEEARNHLILRQPLVLLMPVRMLQGTADKDVNPAVAMRLLDHATGPDIRLTLVKGADHRFSEPAQLDLIGAAIDDLAGNVGLNPRYTGTA